MSNDSLDACLHLVADKNRRRIIHHLRHEADETTTVDEIVDQFHSSGSDSKNDPLQDRKNLFIQLYHVHLPKLAEYGIVEFEHRTGTVRYHPNEQVETVLDSLSEAVSLPNP
ncbi:MULTISPECIES: ArsR family transcriptional regulator [Haloferax]|uniref:ArsR family transcriptional regulator n=1 Tax=Haloferax marinum TaxID=2666143 RepID=A0A6A8G8L6_9EURY|nr:MULTISPECIES: ArsR family transcriptional regulator [Haloferax]KAB1197884.1 ArsR family transcriptional regulator [Haloferax sp. CBA1150]MRW96948.1 ArsR family transcriptional regulator [Haloferax marinum]